MEYNREIINKAETFDDNDNIYMTIVYKENNKLYRSFTSGIKYELNKLNGTEINLENVYPEYKNKVSLFHGELSFNDYLKIPNLITYEENDILKNSFQREINFYELLKNHPHPNICIYKGCIINKNNNRIESIVLKKYEKTLYNIENFDKKKAIDGISSALNHIHSLGYIYTDLNPNNIMFDENNNVVLIDFDSIHKENEIINNTKIGTPYWCIDTETITRENDYHSLNLIINFINKK